MLNETNDVMTSGRPDVKRAMAPLELATVVVIAIGLAVVVLAPVALSVHSLADWGREKLGLTGNWPFVVPVALDCAALVCVGLTFYSVLKADSAGAARLLVWVLAGASATANARHGAEISTDATVFFAAMPLLAALLLDLTLRRVRRTRLADLGGVEPPLPRFRAARWAVAPLETWRAWRIAVRRGITDPTRALELAMQGTTERRPAAVLEDDDGEVMTMTAAGAVRLAFDRLEAMPAPTAADARAAVAWLAERGVIVSENYAYTLARKARDKAQNARPALTVATG
jgi:hypothetical protein